MLLADPTARTVSLFIWEPCLLIYNYRRWLKFSDSTAPWRVIWHHQHQNNLDAIAISDFGGWRLYWRRDRFLSSRSQITKRRNCHCPWNRIASTSQAWWWLFAGMLNGAFLVLGKLTPFKARRSRSNSRRKVDNSHWSLRKEVIRWSLRTWRYLVQEVCLTHGVDKS